MTRIDNFLTPLKNQLWWHVSDQIDFDVKFLISGIHRDSTWEFAKIEDAIVNALVD
jgi:hypothetical protein